VAYKDTVLRAAHEVESGAVGFLKARGRLPLLADSAQASREAFDIATTEYKSGKLAFPLVMHSMEYRVRQEQMEAGARGEVPLRLIALYKALGGGWEIADGKPVIPEDMVKRMKDRSDWFMLWGESSLTGGIPESEIEPPAQEKK
jgi:outer membrane protein TolC